MSTSITGHSAVDELPGPDGREPLAGDAAGTGRLADRVFGGLGDVEAVQHLVAQVDGLLDGLEPDALVREARRGLGDGIDLMIDAGECYDARTAVRRSHQFAEFRPFWLEEMLHPDDVAGYKLLSAASPTPIAAGETECRLGEFVRLLDAGGLDWVQPDPGRCGISTMLAVGRAAGQRFKRTCNHSFKSGITIAASLHVMAALPGVDVFEFCMSDSPLRHDLTREKFEATDGYVAVTDAPGLGVTIDPATVAKYRVA